MPLIQWISQNLSTARYAASGATTVNLSGGATYVRTPFTEDEEAEDVWPFVYFDPQALDETGTWEQNHYIDDEGYNWKLDELSDSTAELALEIYEHASESLGLVVDSVSGTRTRRPMTTDRFAARQVFLRRPNQGEIEQEYNLTQQRIEELKRLGV